jgi:hypothetical protein
MAENTKTPPNQDQRQRTPQGSDADKQQKPGGSVPSSNPDRSRQGQGPGQGMNNPNKPEIDPDRNRQGVNKPEIDPDRDRQNRSSGKPTPGKPGADDVEDLDDDESTQRMDRE